MWGSDKILLESKFPLADMPWYTWASETARTQLLCKKYHKIPLSGKLHPYEAHSFKLVIPPLRSLSLLLFFIYQVVQFCATQSPATYFKYTNPHSNRRTISSAKHGTIYIVFYLVPIKQNFPLSIHKNVTVFSCNYLHSKIVHTCKKKSGCFFCLW